MSKSKVNKKLVEKMHQAGFRTAVSRPIVRANRDTRRNSPCSCGSGAKFKRCCGKPAPPPPPPSRVQYKTLRSKYSEKHVEAERQFVRRWGFMPTARHLATFMTSSMEACTDMVLSALTSLKAPPAILYAVQKLQCLISPANEKDWTDEEKRQWHDTIIEYGQTERVLADIGVVGRDESGGTPSVDGTNAINDAGGIERPAVTRPDIDAVGVGADGCDTRGSGSAESSGGSRATVAGGSPISGTADGASESHNSGSPVTEPCRCAGGGAVRESDRDVCGGACNAAATCNCDAHAGAGAVDSGETASVSGGSEGHAGSVPRCCSDAASGSHLAGTVSDVLGKPPATIRTLAGGNSGTVGDAVASGDGGASLRSPSDQINASAGNGESACPCDATSSGAADDPSPVAPVFE